jgi:hypothetical protein
MVLCATWAGVANSEFSTKLTRIQSAPSNNLRDARARTIKVNDAELRDFAASSPLNWPDWALAVTPLLRFGRLSQPNNAVHLRYGDAASGGLRGGFS